MSTLGKAVITFAADTATFIGDVGKAVAQFERGLGRMQSAVRSIDGPLARLTAGLSIAGVGLFVKNVIDSADELGKLSQKVGISTEKLSEYRLAAELGDVSNEAFAKGLRAFNQSLVEAGNSSSKTAKVFKALGVDVKAGPADAFRQFAQAMSMLPDGELKTAASMEILKKAGADWIPVLNAGAAGLDDAGEKAKNLGLVISTDFAKSAEKFNDNMKLIQKSTIGFANAVLSGGVLDTLVQITSNIEKAAEKGEKWLGILRELQKLGVASIASNGVVAGLLAGPAGAIPGVRGAIQAEAGRQADDLFNPAQQTVSGKIRRPGDSGKSLTASLFAAPDQDALAKALAENEAEIKRYISALRGLEKQLAGLNDQTAEEATLYEVFGRSMTTADGTTVHLEGSLEKLTAEHKTNLLNLALEVTRRQQINKVIELGLPALQAEAAALERSSDILRDFAEQGRLNGREIDFQTKLLALSSREQEKAIALHQIDLELQRKRRELAQAAGEDMELFERENAKLEAEATRQREEAIKGIQERQRVEREWATGSKQAFDEYLDHATNAAEQARMLFGNAFRNMEDALVQFVKTGKLDFKSLADSIITDMIRIMVQRKIMGPIIDGIGGGSSGGILGGISSFLGLGGSGGGAAAAAGDFDFLEAAVAFAAKGGVIGPGGVMPLKAYARGGVASSPQMAVFGEGSMNEAFVPLPDGRRIPVNLGDGGRGKGGDTYIIDARGADRTGLDNLQAQLRAMDGAIEHRAIAATASLRGRGGAFRHIMRR